MSTPSNNNRFKKNRDYSIYAISNTEGNLGKDTFLNNGSNIIKKEYNHFSSPNTTRDSEGVNPYVLDAKIKDLESKLLSLEQANQNLTEKLNMNEKNFSSQIKQLQMNNLEEKENRFKAEKVINNISEQNNANSNDLNIKLNMIQDAIVKGDTEKMIQRQNDLESQKYLIGKLTEKITKTVKSEVEARYKADIEGKIFSQKINNKFENSLDILKKEIEEITNQTRTEMQNISRECSERTHNVSKYIDQQISEAIYGKGSANEELKNFVKKLTEQVKSGLALMSKKNEMLEMRMDNVDKKNLESKNEMRKLINLTEQRLVKKIKDVKLFAEINITNHDKFFERNMQEVALKSENNIKFLAAQLIDTRDKINQRFDKIFQDNQKQLKRICDDMQEVCNRIYKYENVLQEYEKKYNQTSEKIENFVSRTYAREDIHIITERMIRTIEYNFMQEELNKLNNNIQLNGLEFNENLNNIINKNNEHIQQINQEIKDTKDDIINLGAKNIELINNLQTSQDAIEVNQIMKEMITKVDNIMTTESIQESKNTEQKIFELIEEHNNKITNSFQEIDNNKKNISDINLKVTNLENKLDLSGKDMSDMNQRVARMKAENEEVEIKDGVAKVMESMLNYVENSITKEKMDKMGEFDFYSMRKSIVALGEQISILSETSTEIEAMHKDIQKLYEETDTLKNKPKGGDDITLATVQMLNNVEFENIYSILNSINSGEQKNNKENIDYNEIVENKINSAFEKIKNDNEKMWMNVVNMKEKVTDPEEIKKILNEIHPTIVPSTDASKIIDEVEPYEDLIYMPKINGFDEIRKKNNENNFLDNNYKNQHDPGPDITSKKSSKKSGSKKSQTSNKVNNNNNNAININDNTNNNNTNINNNNDNMNNNLNINNEEKNSKNSKTSKKSKTNQVVEQEKKSSAKISKNSKNSKNVEQPKENNPALELKSNNSKKDNQENASPEQNKEKEESESGDDDEEKEEEDKKAENEDLQGKLKKNEVTSGKSLSGIKK